MVASQVEDRQRQESSRASVVNVRVTHFGIGLLSVSPLGQRIFGASQKPMTDQLVYGPFISRA